MRAALYLRVSTEGQLGDDRFGMEAQQNALSTYINANSVEVVAVFRDEGISGATLSRPGLQALLTQAAGSEFDTVLVARMDRLARDLFIQLWVEKELLKYGVEVLSISERFEGRDPMTTAFRQMVGVFAELEKHRIKERMHGGRIEKAKQGGYAGGGAPMGYKAERGGKTLTVDESKVATVRRVFELKDAHPGYSLQRLADTLNGEGFTTARGKTFQKTQVKDILERRALYAGIYKYGGVEAPGRHEAIL